MSRIRLALVGFGKIARDQHAPALAASADFELVAIASPAGGLPALASFPDLDSLLQDGPSIDAVAICTPPQARFALARRALQSGLHVLLEKPPAMTPGDVDALAGFARESGRALFASWHSRHAPAVEAARAWLEGRRIDGAQVTWREDVRVWHPGQHWIWEAGGLGVFDPGINALSILTRILPHAMAVKECELSIPRNCAMPIAARLSMLASTGYRIDAAFDFRETQAPAWTIEIETDRGHLVLDDGGANWSIDGRVVATRPKAEYPDVYARFAQLVRAGQVDADVAPLQIVADAFACGRRITVEAFRE